MGLIKMKEAAEITSLSKSAIYQLCNDNGIPHYRIKGCYRFDDAELQEWVKEQKIEQVED